MRLLLVAAVLAAGGCCSHEHGGSEVSSPRLPQSLEVISAAPAGHPLVPRSSAPLLGTLADATATPSLDASTPAVTEVLRAQARIPPRGLELAGSYLVRVTSQVTNEAAAGSAARFRAKLELQRGADPPVEIAPPVLGTTFAIDTLDQVQTDQIIGIVPPPSSVPFRYEPGDLLEVVLEVEVVTANGGNFIFDIRHDPTSDPDRLLVEWMTGTES